MTCGPSSATVRPDGDRDPGKRAEATVIVCHPHFPDPRRSASVDALGARADRSALDGPEEACHVRQTQRAAVGVHELMRGMRCHRLGECRVHAAVDDSHVLLHSVAARDGGDSVGFRDFDEFKAEYLFECRAELAAFEHPATLTREQMDPSVRAEVVG
jgi:hypothetical protein